jgi:hypothetical protein
MYVSTKWLRAVLIANLQDACLADPASKIVAGAVTSAFDFISSDKCTKLVEYYYNRMWG